ncbi:TnsD family Tn7-like transposition protein [Viridibacillus arvi]|uniref:TnsD family Tn7-like transposition protein n=1 Tax=Viridibacillus arvi TaxID=263475 RepID=UPI0036ECF8AD
MISYFPNPYDDEVIYSIIARYHHNLGNNSRYQTLNELFSSSEIPINLEYFRNLEALGDNLKHLSPRFTENYFEENHTTASVYYPFVKRKQLENNFQIKTLYSYKLRKNDVPAKENLHFCPDCLKEQIEELGEGYWKRLHQIPGIFICLKHKRPLLIHPLNIERMRLNKFILPSEGISGLNPTLNNSEDLSKYISLCEDVLFLSNTSVHFLEEGLFQKYMNEIKIKGLSIPMIKMKEKLSELLLDIFGEIFLDSLNSNPNKVAWTNTLFSKKQLFNMHPIRHVLLMRALSGSAENFLMNDSTFEPFGKGPWLCMNPLSNHYLKKVIERVEISVHSANRKLQGDFICNCGFVYRLRHGESSPLKVEYFSNRIMEKGYIWEAKFKGMLSNGWSLAEIAKAINLSIPTVRKMISEGINPIQNGLRKKNAKIEELRRDKTLAYREVWKDAVKDNPNYSRNELANQNRANYAWLHKHDSEWLGKNSPESLQGYRKKEGISFELEDTELLEKAKSLNAQWEKYEHSLSKPIRKSFTAITKIIGKPNLKYLDNFPLTTKYIQSIHESVEDFQMRKVELVLKKDFNGITVKKYQLLEKTGVRRNIKPSIVPTVESMIDKHNKEMGI